MTSVMEAIWFCAHTPPTDKLLRNLTAPDGENLLCISSLFIHGQFATICSYASTGY